MQVAGKGDNYNAGSEIRNEKKLKMVHIFSFKTAMSNGFFSFALTF